MSTSFWSLPDLVFFQNYFLFRLLFFYLNFFAPRLSFKEYQKILKNHLSDNFLKPNHEFKEGGEIMTYISPLFSQINQDKKEKILTIHPVIVHPYNHFLNKSAHLLKTHCLIPGQIGYVKDKSFVGINCVQRTDMIIPINITNYYLSISEIQHELMVAQAWRILEDGLGLSEQSLTDCFAKVCTDGLFHENLLTSEGVDSCKVESVLNEIWDFREKNYCHFDGLRDALNTLNANNVLIEDFSPDKLFNSKKVLENVFKTHKLFLLNQEGIGEQEVLEKMSLLIKHSSFFIPENEISC